MLFCIFLFEYSSYLRFFFLLAIYLVNIYCSLYSSISELDFFLRNIFVMFLAKLSGNYEFRYSLSTVLSDFG